MSEIIKLQDVKKNRGKKNDAIFDQIFVESLRELKNNNFEMFLQTSNELYQRPLAWEEIVKLPKHELLAFYYRFKENIKLCNSIIDLDKLTQIIQICKTGYGCSGHNFGCSRCNSNCSDLDPEVCSGCAKKMARYIAINYETIMKTPQEKE